MVRTVTRKVLGKRGIHSRTVRFQFEGLNSSQASLAADMQKFNMEFDVGLHTDKKRKYRDSEFATIQPLGYDMTVIDPWHKDK